MKCPKCGYLGFEHVDRCRNCGYDFSLSQSVALPDLAIRHDSTAVGPLDDLTLSDRPLHAESERFLAEMDTDLDRVLGAARAESTQTSSRSPAPVEEPSLFGPPITDDVPLITKASPPRTPLAVRRATPETPRLRSESARAPSLDLPLDLDVPDIARRAVLPPAQRARTLPTAQPIDADDTEAAGVLARLLAVAIDLLILAAVDVVVIYFTLQICGVGLDELAVIPKGPLLAFLLVQNGGYLVAFTAGGQTLGKMAAGIKVVPAEADASLDLGRALLRTMLWFVLAIPVGLGFLSAMFSRDHRGLHDRFAGTRVVRASA